VALISGAHGGGGCRPGKFLLLLYKPLIMSAFVMFSRGEITTFSVEPLELYKIVDSG